MDTSSYLPLAAAAGLQRALDVTAGNMANSATTGHRASRMVFEQMVTQNAPEGGISYAQDRLSYSDLSQGILQPTGNLLDVAIQGDGWLGYQRTDGQIALGRDGRMFLDPDGNLITSEGHAVLDAGGGPIALPADVGMIEIGADGTISSPQGEVFAQIGRFAAPDLATWARIGESMFAPREGGAPALDAAENSQIIQGSLEQSNVNPVTEMVRMIEIQRAFTNNMNFAQNQDQLRSTLLSRLGQRS